jgi:tetratricopeptide (TPR) repeat protein
VQKRGDTRQALSLYQRAVQANPADANAHFNLALLLRSLGYKADGNAQMKIALTLNPKLKDPAAR